jgi:peptide/nickel transport system ATP-binding protein/oligopeptide transport system ATP-binding protein
MEPPLLAIEDLHLELSTFEGRARVLAGVNLALRRGEILGLVGETGCGKTVTGLSISRLLPSPPAAWPRGRILFDGRDVLRLAESELRALRGRRIATIFQDPTTNLNPTFRIGTQLVDVALAAAARDPAVLGLPPGASRRQRRRAARAAAVAMLERVGIADPEARLDAFPHQLSGGQRQRVLIAMALIGRPDLLIADEPTTALDVQLQAQILALLAELVAERRMAVLLITHNLAVVSQVCTEVAVMYAGTIVERGPVAAVLGRPAHPYTRALLAAVPVEGVPRGGLASLPGSVPDLLRPPPGCRFAPRCPLARPACAAGPPRPVALGGGREVACPRVGQAA